MVMEKHFNDAKNKISINIQEKIDNKEFELVSSIGNIYKYKAQNGDYFYLLKNDEENFEYFEIDDSYEIVGGFSCGRALIKRKGKYGYIDEKFNIAIEPKFIYARSFSENLAVFKENGLFGAIDLNGNVTIAPTYETFEDFHENFAAVSKKSLYGYVTKNNTILGINGELGFKKCDSFSYNIAKVETTYKYYIYTDGERFLNYHPDSDERYGYFFMFNNAHNEKVIFLTNGRDIPGTKYAEDIMIFSETTFLDKRTNSFYDVDINEKPFPYNSAKYFVENFGKKYIMVDDNSGKYGLVDGYLNLIFPVVYTEAELKNILNSSEITEIIANNKKYLIGNGKIEEHSLEYENGKINITISEKYSKNCLLFKNNNELNEKDKKEKEIKKYLSKFNISALTDEFLKYNAEYSEKYNRALEYNKTTENAKRFDNLPMLTLTPEQDVDAVYNEYLKWLDSFLNKLQRKKEYLLIIEEIEKCMDFVELGNTDNSNEFYSDLNKILNLFKNLDKELKEKNKKNLLDKLNKELDDISSFINGEIELPYNDVKSWQLNFRMTLQAILLNFKNDYDLQQLKHLVETRKVIVKDLDQNMYHSLLFRYNNILKIINDVKSTIGIYEIKYGLDFSDIKTRLDECGSVQIDYNNTPDEIYSNILSRLIDAIKIQLEVNEMIEPYKYEINIVKM